MDGEGACHLTSKIIVAFRDPFVDSSQHQKFNERDCMPTEEQLNTLYEWACNDDQGGASRYPGQSYEDGIKEVINWLQNGSNDFDRPDLVQ